MGITIYSTQEIANILRAVANTDQASEKATGPGETLVEKGYHKGVQDALVSVGFAFGLGAMVSQDRQDGPIWIEIETNE